MNVGFCTCTGLLYDCIIAVQKLKRPWLLSHSDFKQGFSRRKRFLRKHPSELLNRAGFVKIKLSFQHQSETHGGYKKQLPYIWQNVAQSMTILCCFKGRSPNVQIDTASKILFSRQKRKNDQSAFSILNIASISQMLKKRCVCFSVSFWFLTFQSAIYS